MKERKNYIQMRLIRPFLQHLLNFRGTGAISFRLLKNLDQQPTQTRQTRNHFSHWAIQLTCS